MGQSRTAPAWVNLFSQRSAADTFAALEHKNLQSRLSEIGSRYQSIVTATNDDDVVVCHFWERGRPVRHLFALNIPLEHRQASHLRSQLHLSAFPVLQQFHRCVPARGSHDAASRMRR